MAFSPVALMGGVKPEKKVIKDNIKKITFGKDSYVIFKSQQPGLTFFLEDTYSFRSKKRPLVMRDEIINYFPSYPRLTTSRTKKVYMKLRFNK